jgi:xanthine dehydrogenase accessory factor
MSYSLKSLRTWKFIYQSLVKNHSVILLYVLESKGSSPGRQGFFMAVTDAGEMVGSIGGGIMEHKFVEMAKQELGGQKKNDLVQQVRKQIHDKSVAKNQSGMICSGEQTVWIYRIRSEDISVVGSMIASLEQHKNGTLVLSPRGIEFIHETPGKDIGFIYNTEEEWTYREKTGYKHHLYIIGGGHCALAFSKLMCAMDFYIRVYDERAGLNTMLENDAAHERHFITDYNDLGNLIEAGSDQYVVIMTFGYRTDDIALRALLEKDFGYLGLLGSRKKIERMFEEYRGSGYPEERLQRIHAPAGLAIKSQTPEEIAVSIAAEIIKIKNQDL